MLEHGCGGRALIAIVLLAALVGAACNDDDDPPRDTSLFVPDGAAADGAGVQDGAAEDGARQRDAAGRADLADGQPDGPDRDARPTGGDSAADSAAAADGPGGPLRWGDVYRRIVVPHSCGSAACHDARGSAGRLDMSTAAAAYADLVGVVSKSSTCRGRTRVSPGKPMVSLLYLKVAPNPPCGARCPQASGTTTPPPLSSAEQRLIFDWIAAGAQR